MQQFVVKPQSFKCMLSQYLKLCILASFLRPISHCVYHYLSQNLLFNVMNTEPTYDYYCDMIFDVIIICIANRTLSNWLLEFEKWAPSIIVVSYKV